MNGIYPKILRQAYRLTKSTKSFWVAGLFLVWPNLVRALVVIALILTALSWDQVAVNASQETAAATPWVGLGSLLVIGLLVLYYFRSKAMLFLGVKQLQTAKAIDKAALRKDADPLVSKLLNFSVVATAILGMLVVFLYSPVAYLSSSGFTDRSIILGILATLVLLPTAGLLYCSMIFGPMFMAAHGLSPVDSVRASSDMFRRNWLFLLLLWLLLFAIELVGIVASIAGMFVAMLPFVLLNQIFYDGGGQGVQSTIQALAGIAGFMVFFMSQGMVAAFQRVAWAVTFFEIVRPVKMEEEEPETVPEVIS